jgi:hypothetical protein
MRQIARWIVFCSVAGVCAAAEEGFVPLFNGQDLSGWAACNIAPETFVARDGMIVTTGSPIGTLRTAKMYENFIIEFDWRHMKVGGNSGLFIWADGLPWNRGARRVLHLQHASL